MTSPPARARVEVAIGAPLSGSDTPVDRARQMIVEGRLGEAERAIRALIQRDPNDADAVEAMGELALSRGSLGSAIEFLDIALTLDPGRTTARIALGIALIQLGRSAEALAALQRSADESPQNALAHYWLAQAYLQARRNEEGFESLDRALAIWPHLVNHMGLDLFTRLKECGWNGRAEIKAFLERAAREGRGYCDPLTIMVLSEDPAVISVCARVYGRNHPPLAPMAADPHPRSDRIRLAFVSSDFKSHPVAVLIAGVLEALDRKRFHVTAVSIQRAEESPIRRRIMQGVDEFLKLADEDDETIARTIADRRTDIAISLNGYTEGGRPTIFAHRAAPIQVSFEGFPGTMGVPYIDYLIADRHVIPPGEEGWYDERIVRMPHSYQPTDDKDPIAAAAPSRMMEGLPERAFVFMGYNSTHKISPDIFEVWMRILRRTPGSVLWLRNHTPLYQDNLRGEARERGIDPARLFFARKGVPRPEHLARHRLADLFLDTLPYNAHSTASDALWAGLPVLTCRGKTFPGRVCAGLVHSAGFPELIAEDLETYEEIAVRLGTDPAAAAAVRARVSARAPKSPLFDTRGFAEALGCAFEIMYEKNQAGLPPDHIDLGA